MDLQMCRICGGNNELKNVLDEDSETINKLLMCSNISMHPGDILPKLICIQCENDLDFSYRLRKQSESTEKRLRLEIERKQKALSDTIHKKVNTANTANGQQNCEEIILPQYAADGVERESSREKLSEVYNTNEKEFDIIEIAKADANALIITQQSLKYSHKTLWPTNAEKEKVENQKGATTISLAIDTCYEGNNDVSFAHSNYLNNKSDYDRGNTLKELIKVSTLSEYCSIDLKSSSGSSLSDCSDDIENEQANDMLSQRTHLICDTCHEVFATRGEYNIHIKLHGVERYQCIQCCKFFPSRSRLKRHEDIHNEIASHQCPYCSRSYRALYNLERHIRTAHLGKTWECDICNSSFSRVDALNRHLQLHSEEKKFSCLVCSKRFKTMDYLRSHTKIHRVSNSKLSKNNKRTKKNCVNKKQCDYCGKLLKSPFSYKNHLRIHTNEKPYKCDSCNKDFRTMAALTTHRRIHDDYRPYQCDLCLKSFKQTGHLKGHKIIHENNVPKHVCSVCQAEFTRKVGKLEKLLKGLESSPGVSEEWGSGWKGTNFILEIEETTSAFPVNSGNASSRKDISSTDKILVNITNMVTQGPKIIVRTEEILIVGLVLMLWVGAIILFFNRWGKIRMLEPYQPKFQQQHRSSCPLSDIDTTPHQRSSVSRMSVGFVNNVNIPTCQFTTCNSTIYSKGYMAPSRPRQNSVFVGPSPSQFLMPRPPRKTRSAIDLHSMILDETAEQV